MRKDSNLEGRMDWCENQLCEQSNRLRKQTEINAATGKAFDKAGEAFEAVADELDFLRRAFGFVCMIAGGLTMGLVFARKDIRELKNAMNEG